jgi:hypothetical protein
VIGNPALLNGGSASLILNEVVSGKTSNIAGFLEVVGNKAGVIIAKMDTLIAELDLPKTKLSEAEQAQLNTQRQILLEL